MSVGKRILLFILFPILVVLGCVMETSSFDSLRKMRQMARLPHVEIQHALPGEIHLLGRVERLEKLLKAPRSGQQCVYFRYLEEEERKDSDGDKYWATIADNTEYVPFVLRDAPGDLGYVRVDTAGPIEFEVNQSFYERKGKRRYTEWRIEPKQEVTVFGSYSKLKGGPAVSFAGAGDVHSLITNKPEEEVRRGKGMSSLLLSWGGLAVLSVSVLFLSGSLGIHRLLVYLAILTAVQSGTLFYFGFSMLSEDLAATQQRVVNKVEALRGELGSRLGDPGGKWNGEISALGDLDSGLWSGLAAAERQRLVGMRDMVAISAATAQKVRSGFPDNLTGFFAGVPAIPEVPLPEGKAGLITEVRKAAGLPLFAGGSQFWGWVWIGLGLLTGLIACLCGLRQIKFKRCIENIPTSPIAGVAFGLSEIVGKAKMTAAFPALRGPVSRRDCVYYRYLVKERRGSGKNAKWVTIQDDRMVQPFECEDDTGKIRVFPFDAEIQPNEKSSRRDGRMHYSEWRLEEHSEIYAIGHARVDPVTGEELVMDKPEEKSFPFVVSGFTEKRVMLGKAFVGMLLLNIAFAGAVLAVLMLSGMTASFAPSDYLIAAMTGPVMLVLVAVALHYNDLVFLQKRVDRNWSNIDVSLKKRADLLPALESVVKEFMAHESGLQEALAEARSRFSTKVSSDPVEAGEFLKAENHFTRQFLGMWEAYPDLKADGPVGKLTKTLVDVENEIALMRKGYNDAVETYNTRIQSVPDVFLARAVKFEERRFLGFAPEIAHVPEVILESMGPSKGQDVVQAAVGGLAAAPPLPKGDVEAVPVSGHGAALGKGEVLPSLIVISEEELQKSETALGHLKETAFNGARAAEVLMAILLREDDHGGGHHLNIIEGKLGSHVRGNVEAHLKDVWQLQDVHQAPLLRHCLEQMGQLMEPKLRQLKGVLDELSQRDESISLFEYALNRALSALVSRVSEETRPPAQVYSFARMDHQVSGLFSLLSQLSGDAVVAGKAFAVGKEFLVERDLDIEYVLYSPERLIDVDAGMDELAKLDHGRRKKLVDACRKIAEVGEVAPRQDLFLTAVEAILG